MYVQFQQIYLIVLVCSFVCVLPRNCLWIPFIFEGSETCSILLCFRRILPILSVTLDVYGRKCFSSLGLILIISICSHYWSYFWVLVLKQGAVWYKSSYSFSWCFNDSCLDLRWCLDSLGRYSSVCRLFLIYPMFQVFIHPCP